MSKLGALPKKTRLASVLAVLVGACGSSDGTSGPGPTETGSSTDPATPAAATCTPAALTVTAALDPRESTGATLLDVAVDEGGPWFLAKHTDGSLTIGRTDAASRVVLESAKVTTAALATRRDGTVCAIWGLTPKGVRTACGPSFTAGDAVGLEDLEITASARLAYVDDGAAATLLFEGRYASLGAASRTGSTKWAEVEMYESSISFGGGPRALTGAAEGSPYCWIASQGQGGASAVVEQWGRSGSANELGTFSFDDGGSATRCALATNGSKVAAVIAGSKGNAVVATGSGGPLVKKSTDPAKLATIVPAGDDFAIYTAGDEGIQRSGTRIDTLSSNDVSNVLEIAVSRDSAKTEHVAVQVGHAIYYGRVCP